jgi:hypothetical protein
MTNMILFILTTKHLGFGANVIDGHLLLRLHKLRS